ncbi:MAG: PqqD family protein [Acidobacteriota bacterium]
MDGSHDLQAICAWISEEFSVEPQAVLSDMNDFLGELKRHGLLQEDGGQTESSR